MNFDRTSIDQVVAQAREAYEQKRTRECIALTRTILSADPDNGEAMKLQSAIQLEINRDLHDARGLLEDSHTKDDGQKYRKAAEIILLKTLNLDPTNEEAIALLSLTRGTDDWGVPAAEPAAERHSQESDPPEDLGFTVVTSSANNRKANDSSSFKFPVVFAVFIVLGGVLVVAGYSFFKDRGPESSAEVAPSYESAVVASSARAVQVKKPLEVIPQAQAQPQAPKPIVTSATNIGSNSILAVPPAPRPATADSEPAPSPTEPATEETGRLAVTAFIPADIYKNNKYLGSTPTTLKLPVGRQTLEYRHQDLRTVVTHYIRAKETATAAVTFETVVQINARPWAQVFIDGATRRPLGQTPLSNVRVPIGGVLVFENPNFPAKSHRVNGKDTAIQVVFP